MTAQLFEEMLIVARKYGVLDFKCQGIEVKLAPVAEPQDRNVKIGLEELAPTEDQLLFWSAGGGPSIETEPPA